MNTHGGDAEERQVKQSSTPFLLLVLIVVIWIAGVLAGSRMHQLYRGDGYGSFDDIMQHSWFMIAPLAAIAAYRLRFGADRLLALRASRFEPIFAGLMAVSLILLATYFAGFGMLPWIASDKWNGFGVLSWLGIVLAAGFTWVWLPLFPRITATLVGMFAALGLIAIVADPLFGSCWAEYDPASESSDTLFSFYFIFVSPLATLVWAVGALWLRALGRSEIETSSPYCLLLFAGWSGAIVLALAVTGTAFDLPC